MSFCIINALTTENFITGKIEKLSSRPQGPSTKYIRVCIIIEGSIISSLSIIYNLDSGELEDIQSKAKFTSPTEWCKELGYEEITMIDASELLVLPGFVNCHTHSVESWTRGEIGMYPLELWLANLVDYFDGDEEQIYLSCLLNGVETLLSGGTCILDHLAPLRGHYTGLLPCVKAAAKAYKQIGIRAFVAPLVGDLPKEASIPKPYNNESLILEKEVEEKIIKEKVHVKEEEEEEEKEEEEEEEEEKKKEKEKEEEIHVKESCGCSKSKEYIPNDTKELLDTMREAIITYHSPEECFNVAVGPTGLQLCTDDLFKGMVSLSKEFDLARHTHCLETKAQFRLAHQNYGESGVKHLQTLGFLNHSTTLAHAIWLTEDDMRICKETGATVVHNPLSNVRLGSGIAPLLNYKDMGVNVAIGCDGSASNDGQDMLEAIKLGTFLHNITERDYRRWLLPVNTLHMASTGGYTGLGMGSTAGLLQPGRKADIVLYDLQVLSMSPRTDPIGLLVMGRPQGVVRDVWVDGKRVVAGGVVLGVDQEDLRKQLLEKSKWKLKPRESKTFKALEPLYLAYLEGEKKLPHCDVYNAITMEKREK